MTYRFMESHWKGYVGVMEKCIGILILHITVRDVVFSTLGKLQLTSTMQVSMIRHKRPWLVELSSANREVKVDY